MPQVKSHEKRKILLLGETIRENPRTILLSIPIFAFGLIYYTIIGDRTGVAGSFGHCGITFKNYYQHHWQKKFLLKIAYSLFNTSSKLASGEGKISDILHTGKTALILGENQLALSKFNEAIKEARRINHIPMEGNVEAHIAALYTKIGELEKAKAHLDRGLSILEKAVKENPKSLYVQIWFSGAELTAGEYWLKKRKRDIAQLWAKKAETRSDKYNLLTRKVEAKKLISKIGELRSQ